MKSRSVFSSVLLILLTLILLSISTIAIFSIITLSDLIYGEVENSLHIEGQLIYNFLPDSVSSSTQIAEDFTKSISKSINNRITLILKNGYVIADSHENYELMENHSDRPEVLSALNDEYGISRRYSSTLNQYMLYITIPPGDKDVIVRVALSVDHIREKFQKTLQELALFSIFILTITVIISIYTAKSFTTIIRSIKNISNFYAKGDFSKKLPENGPKEVSELKISINTMGEQLQDIVNKVSLQKNELQAMLNGMVDSVILLDVNLSIKEMNPAAEILTNTTLIECRGLKITDVIKNTEIISLVMNSQKKSYDTEETVYYNQGIEHYLQIHCTPIFDAENTNEGILLVMNNMTRLKQLENMRKDFVANVSHELKTPVTLINGYVETLLDGAKNDVEKLDQFLEIINRHGKRINHIIDDLLILSNIEDKSTNIATEEVALYDILFSAYTSALAMAEHRKITMKIDCNDQLKLTVNPILFEQAVYNLINNAIKYAGSGSIVEIKGFFSESNKNMIIQVKDNGKGMASEQLERIFERFYRIDRKQSKKIGGTGLGLSIVKHIAIAHSGTVHVSSSEGQGSCFEIRIPLI